jgi:hypothetical protein
VKRRLGAALLALAVVFAGGAPACRSPEHGAGASPAHLADEAHRAARAELERRSRAAGRSDVFTLVAVDMGDELVTLRFVAHEPGRFASDGDRIVVTYDIASRSIESIEP